MPLSKEKQVEYMKKRRERLNSVIPKTVKNVIPKSSGSVIPSDKIRLAKWEELQRAIHPVSPEIVKEWAEFKKEQRGG